MLRMAVARVSVARGARRMALRAASIVCESCETNSKGAALLRVIVLMAALGLDLSPLLRSDS